MARKEDSHYGGPTFKKKKILCKEKQGGNPAAENDATFFKVPQNNWALQKDSNDYVTATKPAS